MVYLFHEGIDQFECIPDKHIGGLFSQTQWLQWISETGFEARYTPFVHSEIEPGTCDIFIGLKPLDAKE